MRRWQQRAGTERGERSYCAGTPGMKAERTRSQRSGQGDMNDRRSSLPARLELSLQKNSIVSGFYCHQDELHANVGLPAWEALLGYQEAIARATAGDDSGRPDCLRMRDAIVACLPPELPTLLERLAQGLSGSPLVELEIAVNDRALENYPWELLAEPGALAPPDADVAVWRSVRSRPAQRQASTAVLLIGSASVDTAPPFSHEEVGQLAELLAQYSWINPLPHPSITFGYFSHLLNVIRPTVVHLVVHGSTDGFQFQASGTAPKSHYEIPVQELAGRLALSAPSVVVLSACDSATASQDSDPVARRISLDAATTTIGMAAKLPAEIGMAFAEEFYQDIALGATVLEAHSHAAASIRAISGFANLWSVPVMYSTEPNLVIFPTDPRARARLGFDEVSTHLAKLETEIDGPARHHEWTSGDWAQNTAASSVRIAYVRDVIATLTKTLDERPADLLYALRFRQGCDDLESSLAEVSARLWRLTDPSSSLHERAHSFEIMSECLVSTRHTLRRINQLFAEMP